MAISQVIMFMSNMYIINMTESFLYFLSAFLSAMILSLQKPVLNLMAEIAKIVNTTNVNMTEVVEGMPLAIKDSLLAAQQVRQSLFFFPPHLAIEHHHPSFSDSSLPSRLGKRVWRRDGSGELLYCVIDLHAVVKNKMEMPVCQQPRMCEHSEDVFCVFENLHAVLACTGFHVRI